MDLIIALFLLGFFAESLLMPPPPRGWGLPARIFTVDSQAWKCSAHLSTDRYQFHHVKFWVQHPACEVLIYTVYKNKQLEGAPKYWLLIKKIVYLILFSNLDFFIENNRKDWKISVKASSSSLPPQMDFGLQKRLKYFGLWKSVTF